MKSDNTPNKPVDYQALLNDLRHELAKVYYLNMNPALVLDAIDIVIHERTGLPCVADKKERCEPKAKGLHVTAPPQEKDLWRVVYVIDVNAADAKAAAQETYETMVDPESMAPVLHVIDLSGDQMTIDMSQENKRR